MYCLLIILILFTNINISMESNKINNSEKNYNDNLLKDLDTFSKQLNNTFYNINERVSDMILVDTGKFSRINKLNFNDAVCYLNGYCFINNTKSKVVANLNYENNLIVHESNYQKKEAKIPLLFYENIFINVQKLFYDEYSTENKDKIVSVDGTYNNTNILNDGSLETSLNMGYYDYSNKIPVNITFKGAESKNKEIESFIYDVKNNNLSTDNVIFVFDRAYFSYDFINYLDNNNYNYVIRVKNSCLYLNKEKNKDKINKMTKKINNENARFVNYENKYILNIKGKGNKILKVEKSTKCNLITNLNIDKYDDNIIKNIYKNRWSVEVFFKILKSNFKFSNLINHTDKTKIQYHKQNYVILTQYYIIRIIENILIKNINKLNEHKFNKKNKNKYVFKNNNSLMIEGLKKIINDIINAKINKNILFKFTQHFVKKINIQIDVYKERKCKNPGFKWYIKSYAEVYKLNKLTDALLNNSTDNLNKNLKLFASEIQIIK